MDVLGSSTAVTFVGIIMSVRKVIWTAGLLGCTGEGAPTQQSDLPPDIVVLVASGLRADVGETAAESALLSRFGLTPDIRFSNAYAQSCVPYTSLGSMLSGRYPSAIPLCGSYDANSLVFQEDQEVPWCAQIPERLWTLPRVLDVYGYQTGAYVSNANAAQKTDWSVMTEMTSRWWSESKDSPRFLLVQVLDIHMLQFDPITGYSEQVPGLERRNVTVDSEDLMPLYMERSAEVGAGFRQLIDALPQHPERPMDIWLTSTNGLSLHEEAGLNSDHLQAVTNALIVDRTIHVPLLYFQQQRREREDDRVVELVDLLTTIAARAGASPPASAQGHDLLGTDIDPTPWAYAEFGDMLSLRAGDDMLSFRFFLHNASSLDPRLTDGLASWNPASMQMMSLHNVAEDPMQRNNVAEQQPERLDEMRQQMLSIRQGPGAPPPEEMTAERLESLRLGPANGYW